MLKLALALGLLVLIGLICLVANQIYNAGYSNGRRDVVAELNRVTFKEKISNEGERPCWILYIN